MIKSLRISSTWKFFPHKASDCNTYVGCIIDASAACATDSLTLPFLYVDSRCTPCFHLMLHWLFLHILDPQEMTYVLGEREKSLSVEELGRTCLELETSSHQIKLHTASSCMWCQWRRAMADTEGGSLNPDLRIREKGIPGNRTLHLKEELMKCVLCFWKAL